MGVTRASLFLYTARELEEFMRIANVEPGKNHPASEALAQHFAQVVAEYEPGTK
jgi:hypothetical protein